MNKNCPVCYKSTELQHVTQIKDMLICPNKFCYHMEVYRPKTKLSILERLDTLIKKHLLK